MRIFRTLMAVFVSCIMVGCGHIPMNPTFQRSEIKDNEGVVFGKIDSISYNGKSIDKIKCSMTYGESWAEAAAGGIYEKKIPLQTGAFFAYKMKGGIHQTARFSCYFDHEITSEIQLFYTVQPHGINYLGRITIDVKVDDTTGNFLKTVFSPIPTALDGGFKVLVSDHFKEDSSMYLNSHSELRGFQLVNAMARFRR